MLEALSKTFPKILSKTLSKHCVSDVKSSENGRLNLTNFSPHKRKFATLFRVFESDIIKSTKRE